MILAVSWQVLVVTSHVGQHSLDRELVSFKSVLFLPMAFQDLCGNAIVFKEWSPTVSCLVQKTDYQECSKLIESIEVIDLNDCVLKQHSDNYII